MAVREVKGNPNEFWDEMSWTDLSPSEQKILATLGWDEDSWEEETDAPESDDKYWEALTDEEKDAAKKLGYTEAYWDEE
jgi:hypothetical protein